MSTCWRGSRDPDCCTGWVRLTPFLFYALDAIFGLFLTVAYAFYKEVKLDQRFLGEEARLAEACVTGKEAAEQDGGSSQSRDIQDVHIDYKVSYEFTVDEGSRGGCLVSVTDEVFESRLKTPNSLGAEEFLDLHVPAVGNGIRVRYLDGEPGYCRIDKPRSPPDLCIKVFLSGAALMVLCLTLFVAVYIPLQPSMNYGCRPPEMVVSFLIVVLSTWLCMLVQRLVERPPGQVILLDPDAPAEDDMPSSSEDEKLCC